jgi:hypothetical protein
MGATGGRGPEGPPGPAGALEPGAAIFKPLSGPYAPPPPAPSGYAYIGIFKLEKPAGDAVWFALHVRVGP